MSYKERCTIGNRNDFHANETGLGEYITGYENTFRITDNDEVARLMNFAKWAFIMLYSFVFIIGLISLIQGGNITLKGVCIALFFPLIILLILFPVVLINGIKHYFKQERAKVYLYSNGFIWDNYKKGKIEETFKVNFSDVSSLTLSNIKAYRQINLVADVKLTEVYMHNNYWFHVSDKRGEELFGWSDKFHNPKNNPKYWPWQLIAINHICSMWHKHEEGRLFEELDKKGSIFFRESFIPGSNKEIELSRAYIRNAGLTIDVQDLYCVKKDEILYLYRRTKDDIQEKEVADLTFFTGSMPNNTLFLSIFQQLYGPHIQQ